ncbi:hypothetical protein [Flagellimonas iocasae]|uniref:Uncharacterized protein n=1 Tax=Flagellimonas iocasae TaxID=2055905 RepID=A0ABW4XZP5_9FLAO
MKQLGFLIPLLIFCFSDNTFAQHDQDGSGEEKRIFFGELAQRDAVHEQSLISYNKEDELDFWRDQERYEKDLQEHHHVAYNAYMEGKKEAYLDHAKLCGDKCTHSDSYFERAYFYYSYEQPDIKNTVSTIMGVQIPSIGDNIFQ